MSLCQPTVVLLLFSNTFSSFSLEWNVNEPIFKCRIFFLLPTVFILWFSVKKPYTDTNYLNFILNVNLWLWMEITLHLRCLKRLAQKVQSKYQSAVWQMWSPKVQKLCQNIIPKYQTLVQVVMPMFLQAVLENIWCPIFTIITWKVENCTMNWY